MSVSSQRIERLMQALPPEIDGVLLTSQANRFYFSGMASSDGLLLAARGRSALMTDSRYIEAARGAVRDIDVILSDASHGQLAELCAERGIRTLAVEAQRITLAEYSRLRERLPELCIIDGGEADCAINALRRCKDAAELAAIEAAQAITDAAFAEICGFIREGVTEKEIAARLEYCMKQRGADGFAFDTIAVTGADSSMPHGVPSDKPVAAGDFVTLDFGARCGGYCSDMTRTVAVGNISDEMRALYDTVLAAQMAALAFAAQGKPCAEIDAVARGIINTNYKGCFGHGLGHSVGIEIHEEPRFSPSSGDICRAGDIMTVEPGIYIEGKYGCRIEDMVCITSAGVKNLTKSPKELIIL